MHQHCMEGSLISYPRMSSSFLPLRTGKASSLLLHLHLPANFNSPLKALWLLFFLAGGCLPLSEHCNEAPCLTPPKTYLAKLLKSSSFSCLCTSFLPACYTNIILPVYPQHSAVHSCCLFSISLTLPMFHTISHTALGLVPFFMSFTVITSSALHLLQFVSAPVTDTLSQAQVCHGPKDKESWSRTRIISLDFGIQGLLQL